MLVTEEQAKEMWCPEARVIDDLSESASTARLTCANTRCIASKCMWWRLDPSNEGFTPPISLKGYCGMAGKP